MPPPGLPVGDDKKCKNELSSDAVELSGGFFYCEPRSTIVRVAWLSLSRIKSISQSPNRLPSAYFGAFVYAVPDARGLMPAQGAVHLMAAVHGKNVRFQHGGQLLLSLIKN